MLQYRPSLRALPEQAPARTAADGRGGGPHQLDHASLADHAIHLRVFICPPALQFPVVLHQPLHLVLWPCARILQSGGAS